MKHNLLILFRQLRLHQWSKNAILFVPALADHKILQLNILINSIISFFAFSMLASCIYILNDIIDFKYDREHPQKKYRPIANGELSKSTGYILMSICFIIGIFLSLNLGKYFLIISLSYILLNLSYSFYFKTIIILDVVLLMSFYTLRLIAGHIPNNIPLSPWLLSFSIFIFISLGFLKRYIDINTASNNNIQMNRYDYNINDKNILMTLGIASGLISTLVLILYTGSAEVQKLYNNPMILVTLAPLIIYWISRMWLLADRNEIKSDPVLFAIKDKILYLIIVLFIFILGISKY
tara:strand:- start:786 stop:1667 length:882 start_codon:yes stop_codon:yes gene_type:complete